MNDVFRCLNPQTDTGPGLSPDAALSTTGGRVRMCPLSSSVHRQDTVTLAGVWADQSTVEDGGRSQSAPQERGGHCPFGWRQMLEMKRKEEGGRKAFVEQ